MDIDEEDIDNIVGIGAEELSNKELTGETKNLRQRNKMLYLRNQESSQQRNWQRHLQL